MSMRYPGGLIATTPVNQQYPSGVWTGAQTTPYQTNNVWANDSSFKNTTMLLHGDGATTPFIKDASTNNFQITLNGDTKPNNLTPFITNGYWSDYFNGSSFETVAGSTNLAFGTGDFTIECWVNFNSVASGNWLDMRPTSTNGLYPNLYVSSGTLAYFVSSADRITGGTVTTGIWYHIALCRSATSTKLFLNGTQVGSTYTDSNNYICGTNRPMIGGNGFTNAGNFNAYISNFRFIKGTALYTTTFTSPTTPLTAISGTSLLICQSNRFVDNSASPYTITTSGTPAVSMQQPFTAPSGTSLYGSGYFDGSGDSLTLANNAAFNFGANNFTIEAWVYVTATPGGSGAVIVGKNSATYPGGYEFNFVVDTGRTVFFGAYTTTLVSLQGAIVTSLNSWNHVAAVRSGSNWALFVNGVRDVTATSSGTIQTTSSSVYVGDYGGGSRNLTGYISNVRLVNGSAVYDPTVSTLTVPTSPLATITNTQLLTLQTNGPENNNGFLDSSYNSFVITRNGNTTQGTFTPYGSSWSSFFIGAGNYMTTPSGSATTIVGTINSSLNLCIECWIYLNEYSGSSSFPALIGNMDPTAESDDWSFGPVSTGALMFYWFEGGQRRASTTSTIPLNTWTHIAVNISTGVITLFINGVSQTLTGTTTLTTGSVGRNYLTLGQWNNGVSGSFGLFKGYVSNLRVIKASTYTANFTPSTAPLTAVINTSLLIFQSNRFIDNSTNAFAITTTGSPSVQAFQPFVPTVQYTPSTLGGSGYFDGSGDYLSVANNGLFGSGNWTFECWVNAPVGQSDKPIIDARNSAAGAGTTTGFTVTMITSTQIRLWSGSQLIIGTVNYINTWVHIAVVKSGSTTTMYFNGVSVGTTTSLGNMSDTSFVVGGGYYGSTSINAFGNFYASNMRVVKGSAVYTSNFTPPTAPVTAIANTALLMDYTNAAIFDNSGMNNLETVGNAQVNTGVVKYGTGSMYFDGTGDYLLLQGGQNFTFGTGDFTIEMWIYVVSGLSADIVYYDGRPTSTNGLYNIIYTNSTGKLVYSTNSADRITSTTTLSTATWYHIALSRSGTNTKLFLNGTQEGSTYTDSNSYIVGTNRPVIGGNGYTLGNAPLNGYIDDLRITKGVARYVTNFTPPVARMPNQ